MCYSMSCVPMPCVLYIYTHIFVVDLGCNILYIDIRGERVTTPMLNFMQQCVYIEIYVKSYHNVYCT